MHVTHFLSCGLLESRGYMWGAMTFLVALYTYEKLTLGKTKVFCATSQVSRTFSDTYVRRDNTHICTWSRFMGVHWISFSWVFWRFNKDRMSHIRPSHLHYIFTRTYFKNYFTNTWKYNVCNLQNSESILNGYTI